MRDMTLGGMTKMAKTKAIWYAARATVCPHCGEALAIDATVRVRAKERKEGKVEDFGQAGEGAETGA